MLGSNGPSPLHILSKPPLLHKVHLKMNTSILDCNKHTTTLCQEKCEVDQTALASIIPNLPTSTSISSTQNKSSLTSNNQPVLRRNIFAGLMTTSISTSKSIYHEEIQSLFLQEEQQSSISLLESSPMVEDMMLSSGERRIYENLSRLGVRMADPMELQYNYYQKVRSAVFNLSSQDKLLSPQPFYSSIFKPNIQQDSDAIQEQDQHSQNQKECVNQQSQVQQNERSFHTYFLNQQECTITNLDLSGNRIFNNRQNLKLAQVSAYYGDSECNQNQLQSNLYQQQCEPEQQQEHESIIFYKKSPEQKVEESHGFARMRPQECNNPEHDLLKLN